MGKGLGKSPSPVFKEAFSDVKPFLEEVPTHLTLSPQTWKSTLFLCCTDGRRSKVAADSSVPKAACDGTPWFNCHTCPGFISSLTFIEEV